MSSGSIGIMSGAYFVSRKDLLTWVNTLLEVNYPKVEQMSNGAAFCQIVDAMYPGKGIPLSEVKYNARTHDEIMNNYKILQSAFAKCKITKSVEIEKLTQGHFQDNFEFLQWFKSYYDKTITTKVRYNARERRRKAGCPDPNVQGTLKTSRRPPAAAAPPPKPLKRDYPSHLATSARPVTVASGTSAQAPAKKVTRTTQVVQQQHQQRPRQQTQLKSQRQTMYYAQEPQIQPPTIEALAELRYDSKELTSERNFYYKKLLMIEEVCKKVLSSENMNPDPTLLTASVLEIIEGDCYNP